MTKLLVEESETIIPDQGGTIEIPGVARLYIPPNALPAERPVFARLVTLEPPPELVTNDDVLSPVVWVRFRGLSTPYLNEPVLLTIQPTGQSANLINVHLLEDLPEAAYDRAEPTLVDDEVVIPLRAPGWVVLTQPLASNE
ncbi:MAG: hypothetical protein QME76_06650 [Bacillota bacterium]|nr:hypothetical protein [Bacillota bacterium]